MILGVVIVLYLKIRSDNTLRRIGITYYDEKYGIKELKVWCKIKELGDYYIITPLKDIHLTLKKNQELRYVGLRYKKLFNLDNVILPFTVESSSESRLHASYDIILKDQLYYVPLNYGMEEVEIYE